MAERPIKRRLNQGEVSARAANDHQDGELTRSVGVEYLPGDPYRAWKLRGRKLFATVGGGVNAPRGIKLLKFDNGNDKLATIAGTALFLATPGIQNGTFTSVGGTRQTTNVHLSAAHMDDKWFLVTGADRNSVVSDDGTVRDMSLEAPYRAPAATRNLDSGVTVSRAEAFTESTGWNDEAKAYDDPATNPGTFASASLNSAGSATCTWYWNTSNADANRRLRLRVRIKSAPRVGQSQANTGNAPSPAPGYKGTLAVEVSGNYNELTPETATWTERYNSAVETIELDRYFWIDAPVVANNDQTAVRVTLTYSEGTSPATVHVQNIKIENGSPSSGITLETGKSIGYAYSEYIPALGIESNVSPVVFVDLANHNSVTLSFAGISTENTAATHRIIYRTPPIDRDDPAAKSRLGQIDVWKIDATDNDYRDTFDEPHDEQAFPLVELLDIRSANTSLYYPANTPAPQMSYISAFDGALVGVNGRQLYRSLRGRPESWPEILVVDKFPMPDHDVLVACEQVGDALLIAATEYMFAIDALPDIIGGQFFSPKVRKVSEFGLCGPMALVVFSVGGQNEDVAAWVSDEGIHVSNTVTSRKLTDDVDWSRFDGVDQGGFVLEWLKDTQQLVFAYHTSGTTNDRYALIHMNPIHRKPDGSPKITWDHYGRIGSMVAGKHANRTQAWTTDATSGKVYAERQGNKDESQAYSGTLIPYQLAFRLYGEGARFGVNRLRIDHTGGDKASLEVTVKNMVSTPPYTSQQVVVATLVADREADITVGRMGEAFDVELEHTGKERLALSSVRLFLDVVGSDAEPIVSGL